ncbi:hypothetical protein [Methylobacter luteus]|uniref:hypothetical protein n=1 Tax=Methylobacter luteus TaxID=415 RepID=UPI00040B15CC|nr:hypothetical protein [Methylobacter luteus]
MTERIGNRYRPLFEVRLLHHYWLDDGATVFDLISDQPRKSKRLQTYDRRPFLTVAPTAATAKALQALNCVYKDTALGLIVMVPGLQVIPTDTLFEFIVTVTHADFFNYTALTLPPRKIDAFYHQAEDKTYRYKTNIFVLSNLTGASRDAGSNKTLFLSSPYSAGNEADKVEYLVLSDGGLVQLTSDSDVTDPISQQLNADATVLPVFVHQDDVPAIVPPPGLVEAPERGLLLTSDIPDDVFALIRLSPIRADDNDFSFIDDNGIAKEHHPIFQVRFKNRSTFWRYINKNTRTVNSTEPDPLPLTYFGNAGPKQKPSEGLVKAEKSGTKITRLLSEIFI